MHSALLILGITFHGLPNDVMIGFQFIFAMFFSMVLIRGLYIWMHRPHQYPNDQVHLAVLGSTWLKLLTIPMMAALLILTVRIESGIPSGQFWQLDSLTRGWWCVIRILIGALSSLCASVFETHPAFRMWASLTTPLVSVLDLCSQANFAVQISCIEHGLCSPDNSLKAYLYSMAWRDIVSAVISLTFSAVSIWLWFIYGVWRNDLFMPRMELRKMSTRLDKVKIRPKEIRRTTEDANQLEKMLGYN